MALHEETHRAKRRQRRRVRSFHAGGSIKHQGFTPAQREAHDALWPDNPAPVDVSNLPLAYQLALEIRDGLLEAGIPQSELDLDDILRSLSSSGGGGGGGTSYSVSDIGPVRAALERAAQTLAERQQSFTEEITRLQFAQTTATADRRDAIDQQLANVQSQLAMLTQLRDQVNAQLTMRGQDITLFGLNIQQRGQDIGADQARFDSELQQLRDKWARQMGSGQLQLAQETQNQIVQLTQEQNELLGRGQDVTQRGQDIDAQIAANDQALRDAESQRRFAIDSGDLALKADAERRIRAIQQQQTLLDQFGAELETAEFAQTGQQGAGNIFSNIGRDLGQQNVQRQQFISQLLANPRDAPQANIALGGGVSFFDQLLAGQDVGGQSLGNIGTRPLLGDLFLKLLQEVNDRPELAFFDEAAEFARTLGTTEGPQAPSLADLQAPLGNLQPVSAPPQAPAPFVPTPVAPPPVAPIPATVIDPVSTGVPDPLEQQFADDALAQILASFENPTFENRQMSSQEQLALILGNPYTGPAPVQQQPAVGFKGGGDFVTDEPLFMVTADGQVKATLGERTPEFPQGIPEKVEITPLAHGGTVTAHPDIQAMKRRAQERLTNKNAEIARRSEGRSQGLRGTDLTSFISRAPTPPTTRPSFRLPQPDQSPALGAPPPSQKISPGITPPPQGFSPVGRPIRGPFLGPAITPPSSGLRPGAPTSIDQIPPGLINIRPPLRPPPPQGFSPVGRPIRGPFLGPAITPPSGLRPPLNPFIGPTTGLVPPRPQLPPQPNIRAPGEILRSIQMGLTPRTFGRVLTPGQLDFTSGQVSALGFDPNDFFTQLIRGFPKAPNPGVISRASFKHGGTVTAPGFFDAIEAEFVRTA